MRFTEDIFVTNSVEIQAKPEQVFAFLYNLKTDEDYRAWHPDHVAFRWEEGAPWQEGSVAYAEEYLHGKLSKAKFVVTKHVPNQEIVYVPVSRVMRWLIPEMGFSVTAKGEGALFTASLRGRMPLLLKALLGKKLQEEFSSIKVHMQEEGETLRKALAA